jgi:hypothetical protein
VSDVVALLGVWALLEIRSTVDGVDVTLSTRGEEVLVEESWDAAAVLRAVD